MNAISLFSGIGGFDLGFEKAGIRTVLQAEQDQHCLKVLARHWPHVERVTDVREVRGLQLCAVDDEAGRVGGDVEAGHDSRRAHSEPATEGATVDLVFGGFPCQDISVAGKRAGLSGERSGLWFEFARVIDELRPRWVCIENVAGLLSSGRPPGADLGLILDTLVELGYGVAWRTLDAQFFGVPQRRRRVFLVGCLGDHTAASAVLAVREGGAGDSQAGGAAGEDVALSLRASTGSRGTDDPDRMTFIPDTAYALAARNAKGVSLLESQDTFVGATQGVRRLTPIECERLQGFPDGWTEGQADSHRYRQLGNAVCVPVAEYIGHRLMRVEELLS